MTADIFGLKHRFFTVMLRPRPYKHDHKHW